MKVDHRKKKNQEGEDGPGLLAWILRLPLSSGIKTNIFFSVANRAPKIENLGAQAKT